MEIFQKNKKVFLIVGIIVVAVILHMFFRAGSSSSTGNSLTDPTADGLVSNLSASPADAIIGRDLLNMLQQLKSISLDTEFFNDKGFSGLIDVSRPIEPQPFGKPLGRSNPFGDFGRTGTASSTVGNTLVVPSSAFGVPR